MYTQVSDAFRKQLASNSQTVCSKIIISYAKYVNGKTSYYTRTLTDAYYTGLEIEYSAFDGDQMTFGSTVAGNISFELYNWNKMWDTSVFDRCKIEAFVGFVLDDGTKEYVPMGIFTVDSSTKTPDTIRITGIDHMAELGKQQAWIENWPATTQGLLDEIAARTKIKIKKGPRLQQVKFKKPNGSTPTYRELLGEIAAVEGGFFTCNRFDEFEIVRPPDWANRQPWLYALNPGDRMDLTLETGVQIAAVYSKWVGWGRPDISRIGTFEDGYIQGKIHLGDIPLIDQYGGQASGPDYDLLEGVIKTLYTKYKDFKYYPFTATIKNNPLFDLGDALLIKGTNMGDVFTFIGENRYSLLGNQEIGVQTVTPENF